MKQYFYFFFDNKNELCCINEYNCHYRKYHKNDAIDALVIANNLNIQKISIKNNQIKLFSKHNFITIDDLKKFYYTKYYKLLPKISNTIQDSFRYSLLGTSNESLIDNMDFYTETYKKKIATNSGRLAIFAGALLLVTASSYKINKEIEKKTIKNSSIAVINIQNLNSAVENSNHISNVASSLVESYLEEERLKAEEFKRKDYKNFTSYTAETKHAFDSYFDIVYAEATRWGLDPNLVMAMLIQESHGRHANLMQISYSSWRNHTFDCYDFIDQEYKKVSLKSFNTPEDNIRAGCMILRHSINEMNGNIMAGVQCYNLGDGNMNHVINITATLEGISKEEVLANQDDLLFVPYTKYASGGDKHYIANISKYLNKTDFIYYLDMDSNNNIIEYKYNLKEKEKVLKK